MRKFRNNKGFTLIELMIVVAIIGILAAIAIPNFIRYQLKSKTAESRTNIGGIKTSQESFRATEDFYANIAVQVPAGAPSPAKQAWGEAIGACTGCDRTAANAANCNLFDCIGFRPAGDVYFQYTSEGQPQGVTPDFCATAQGDLDGDGNISEFEMGSDNNGTGTVFDCAATAAGTCGALTAPGEVFHCLPDVF